MSCYMSLFCPMKSLYSIEGLKRARKHFHVGFSVWITATKIYQNVSYWRGGRLKKRGGESLVICQDKNQSLQTFRNLIWLYFLCLCSYCIAERLNKGKSNKQTKHLFLCEKNWGCECRKYYLNKTFSV